MTVRPAQLADASSIAAVHVTTWQAAYTGLVPQPFLDSLDPAAFTERWQQWLTAPNHTVFVAEAGGALQGFVGGGPIREPHPPFDAELYAIYLLPSAQRQGLGRQLFLCLARALASQGHESLLLWALRDNASTGFYQRLGGNPVSESTLEIGGEQLPTQSFGWHSLPLLHQPHPSP